MSDDRGARTEQKTASVARASGMVVIGDLHDLHFLKRTCANAETVFLLTPESPTSRDGNGETKTLLANHRSALEGSSVRKIVDVPVPRDRWV